MRIERPKMKIIEPLYVTFSRKMYSNNINIRVITYLYYLYIYIYIYSESRL